jgi:catechol 2,3-dioxygenase-like lactoylglutathione lyase family enzyme
VLGKFHEISIATRDIAESVVFYERLGFSQCGTTDTWSHPYGVLTDGRVYIGLHQLEFASPTLTYVRPGVARHALVLEERGIEIAWRRFGDDAFNQFAFTDPSGLTVRLQEAATHFSSSRERSAAASLLGDFAELSLPAPDFDLMREFWEPLGFVAMGEYEAPYLRLSMTSDHLDLAVHRPRTHEAPMLVFQSEDMPERIERLRAEDAVATRALPRGLDASNNALIEAPEGTTLLLLAELD